MRRSTSVSWAFLLGAAATAHAQEDPPRIAIIGGSLSGALTAKYLVDHDRRCALSTIHLFDDPSQKTTATTATFSSRSAAVALSVNETQVDWGASVAYLGNVLVEELMEGDGDVSWPRPSGNDHFEVGTGIYSGGKRPWPFPHEGVAFSRNLPFKTRHGQDIIKVHKASRALKVQWKQLVQLLNATSTIFTTPQQMYENVGMDANRNMSYATLLRDLKIFIPLVSKRRMYDKDRNFRDDFFTAVHAHHVGGARQNFSSVSAWEALAGFAALRSLPCPATIPSLAASALRQAYQIRLNRNCATGAVQERSQRVQWVLYRSGSKGFDLYAENREHLGTYDQVVIAAPLAMAGINFRFTNSSLTEEPVLPWEVDETDTEAWLEGPKHRQDEASPRVTTTIVSNATLQKKRVHLTRAQQVPNVMLVSEIGQSTLYGISSISQLAPEVFRVVSIDALEEEARIEVFGSGHVVESVHVGWTSPLGSSTDLGFGFVLFEAEESRKIYYPNALEDSSFASTETSAMGAKAVAKLMAHHLDLLPAGLRDEL